MTGVAVHGLVKSFPGRPPVRALRGVDLDVASGSITAVLGPSGCGKTTLLRLLAGFDRPDAGTITIGDRTVSSRVVFVAPERRRVGIVPQEGALFPHLDVGANVAFGLRRLPRRARAGRVGEMLELVGLAGYERRRPHELSGGQQQRVALARALAPEPDVVLLDEPFTALDTGLRSALRDEVAAMLADAGVTAILVTHDQTEALTMADQVALMRAGTIVQAAAPEAIYREPTDLDVARFLGDVVLLEGDGAGDQVTCLLGSLTCAGGRHHGPVTVVVRPEQIHLVDGAKTKAVVHEAHFQGHDALVDLTVGSQQLMARWSSTQLPALGAVVGIEVVGPVVAFDREREDATAGDPPPVAST